MIQAKSMIDQKIETLEQQLLTVKGTETEKYARIVGYYRSVKNWNRGKKEEYKYRVSFSGLDFNEKTNGTVGKDTSAPKAEKELSTQPIATYIFFYRTTCPNCPPVKNVIKTLEIAGESINADTNDGFTKAANFEVFAAPTVIFLDKEGKEVLRTSSAPEIKKLLEERKIV